MYRAIRHPIRFIRRYRRFTRTLTPAEQDAWLALIASVTPEEKSEIRELLARRLFPESFA